MSEIQVDIERLIKEWKNQCESKAEDFEPEVVTGENSVGKYTEVTGLGVTVRTYHRDKHSIFRRVA